MCRKNTTLQRFYEIRALSEKIKSRMGAVLVHATAEDDVNMVEMLLSQGARVDVARSSTLFSCCI